MTGQIQRLLYAMAGVAAVIGAIEVYICMNNDEGKARRVIASTIAICAALIAAAQIIG